MHAILSSNNKEAYVIYRYILNIKNIGIKLFSPTILLIALIAI